MQTGHTQSCWQSFVSGNIKQCRTKETYNVLPEGMFCFHYEKHLAQWSSTTSCLLMALEEKPRSPRLAARAQISTGGASLSTSQVSRIKCCMFVQTPDTLNLFVRRVSYIPAFLRYVSYPDFHVRWRRVAVVRQLWSLALHLKVWRCGYP